MAEKKRKVVCIGWHKTGTTTLGDCLLILGYNVVGCRLDLADSLLKGDIELTLKLVENFDAFQDIPWAALYKEIDQRYPNSKFIVSERDEEKWLASALNHFKDLDVPLHEWLYGVGVMQGNEQLYLERYRQHYREVKEYFRNRPKDVLYIDLNRGDGWDQICSFLDCPIPRKRFPHSNKSRNSFTLKDKLFEILKKLTPMPLRRFRLVLLRSLGVPDPRFRFNNREKNQAVRTKLKRKGAQ